VLRITQVQHVTKLPAYPIVLHMGFAKTALVSVKTGLKAIIVKKPLVETIAIITENVFKRLVFASMGLKATHANILIVLRIVQIMVNALIINVNAKQIFQESIVQ